MREQISTNYGVVVSCIYSVSHLGLDLDNLGAGLAGNVVGGDVADGVVCKSINRKWDGDFKITCSEAWIIIGRHR